MSWTNVDLPCDIAYQNARVQYGWIPKPRWVWLPPQNWTHDSELELDIIWPILCWPITIIVRKDKWKPRLMIHHFNSCFQPRMFTIESYADSGLIELARGFQWKGGFYHEISVSWKRSIQNWCIIFQKNWLVICLSPLVHFGGWVDRERSCVSCLVMPHDVPTTPKSLGSSPVEITFCLGW